MLKNVHELQIKSFKAVESSGFCEMLQVSVGTEPCWPAREASLCSRLSMAARGPADQQKVS